MDFATVNSHVILSIGECTYVGFSLKPSSTLPISNKYRVETFLDGKPIGTYPFAVVPPADAIPSKIIEANLAKGVDDKRAPVQSATQFAAGKKVYLAVRADLGNGTAVEVNWYVNGKLSPEGTRSISASRNVPNTRFYFACLPAGGWKKGKNEAVLIMNGNEAGRYAFNVK